MCAMRLEEFAPDGPDRRGVERGAGGQARRGSSCGGGGGPREGSHSTGVCYHQEHGRELSRCLIGPLGHLLDWLWGG